VRHLLKRHPFAVDACFRHCLVLTYALPEQVLMPLLAPGLRLDTFEGWGFLAVALVQTERLRPSFVPAAFGQSFFLTGYRVFTRYTTAVGKNLRGLRILRSDTDRPFMALIGNLFTHYAYHPAEVNLTATAEQIEVRVKSRPAREADLHVLADLTTQGAPLPPGSPFHDIKEARRFAGPLPFTFDYEPETHSIIRVQGVRQYWDPQSVHVDVRENTFLCDARFGGVRPLLANAFYIKDIPYRWRPGIREPLPRSAP
jgi:hypothetical protein